MQVNRALVAISDEPDLLTAIRLLKLRWNVDHDGLEIAIGEAVRRPCVQGYQESVVPPNASDLMDPHRGVPVSRGGGMRSPRSSEGGSVWIASIVFGHDTIKLFPPWLRTGTLRLTHECEAFRTPALSGCLTSRIRRLFSASVMQCGVGREPLFCSE